MLLHAGLTFAQQYNYSIRLRPPLFAAMRKEAKISSASWLLGSQRQGPALPTPRSGGRLDCRELCNIEGLFIECRLAPLPHDREIHDG